MKREVGLLIIFSLLFVPHSGVEGAETTVTWSWDTGTKIDVIAVIDSTTLESGQHQVLITVRLIDLNDDANDIHDIEVQYRIPGYYTSSIVYFDPIATTGNYQTLSRFFNYQTEWGINYLEFKIECKEDIPFLPDNYLVSDWLDFFILSPAEDPTTPTTPTTPTIPTNGNGEGFDISKHWYIFLIAGVVWVGIAATVIFLVMRRR